jgi:leader peptidase (prepilin peptidase)/N-methyltransferase
VPLDLLGLYFQQHPLALALVAGAFGLVIGSFLNVVIHRLPIMLQRGWRTQCQELLGQPIETSGRYDLMWPRSRCPHCDAAIGALQNVPVLSFLFLRGRCAQCGVRISVRYPLVELATGVLSAVVAWHFGWQGVTLAALTLTWSLIALTVIDLDHQLLPDSITLPLLWLGLALNSFSLITDLHSAVIGAICGYLFLWAVFHAFKLLTGKEGMGYGDFKLFALAGAWMGWQMLPVIILIASLVGAIVGIALILLRGHDRNIPIPFGPFLSIAIWIALLWGPALMQSYFRLARLGT